MGDTGSPVCIPACCGSVSGGDSGGGSGGGAYSCLLLQYDQGFQNPKVASSCLLDHFFLFLFVFFISLIKYTSYVASLG